MTLMPVLAPVAAAGEAVGCADVWLVRHAPTSWTGHRWCGRSDPALTVEGRRIAAMTAIRLVTELPAGATILSSPLRRAHQTAAAIAAAVGGSVDLVDDLIEVDFGRVEGLTWGELSTREPGVADAILACGPVDWPGGETAAAASGRAARMATAIQALDGPVVVVGHGRFLAALHAALDPADRIDPIPPAPGGVIRVRLAGREGNG